MSEPIDDWDALPIVLTVNDAARVLRIGRSKAYEMAALYTSSSGTRGLPCLRIGDLVRIPKVALHEFVTTGHIAQLARQPDDDAIANASARSKRPRTPRAGDRSQLSLLGSD